jgi:hypothetical protein
MKMTADHYAHISQSLDGIRPLILQAAPEYKAAGLSDKRLRWDALYKCGLTSWICDNLYSYLNDDHIDTALRAYFKQIGV